MLTSNTPSSRQSLRAEYQALKQLTQRKDGTPADQETLPKSVFVRTEDRFEHETGIQGMAMTTDSFGDLESGNYSKNSVMRLNEETTFERYVDFQKSDSGRISYLELVDIDGDGNVDVKNDGAFKLGQPEANLLQ